MGDNTTQTSELGQLQFKSWEQMLEILVDKLLGEVPFVGGWLETLAQILWPENEDGVWDQIKDQVKQLIDAEILQQEMESLQDQLTGIEISIKNYTTEQSVSRRGELLTGTQLLTTQVMTAIIPTPVPGPGSVYHPQSKNLIPLLVATAHIDLTLGRELVNTGKLYFPDGDQTQWENDLYERYAIYYYAFRDLYSQWLDWRKEQITYTYGPGTSFGTVQLDLKDAHTGFALNYQTNESGNVDFFQPLGEAAQTMIMSQAVAKMATALSSTFYMGRYQLHLAGSAPLLIDGLSGFSVGPVGISTLGLGNDAWQRSWKTTVSDTPGKMKSVALRHGNIIDFMQVNYDGYSGNAVGNPTGGTPVTISPFVGDHFCGFALAFANNVLNEAAVYYSSGYGGDYGNAGGWEGFHFDASVGSAYEMVGASYAPGRGPGGGAGIEMISFDFKHKTLVTG